MTFKFIGFDEGGIGKLLKNFLVSFLNKLSFSNDFFSNLGISFLKYSFLSCIFFL